MKHQNTKSTLSPGPHSVSWFPAVLNGKAGILPIPVMLDLTVGEEIGLYWLDPTSFMNQLASVRPFQLFLRCGVFASRFGPLMWQLFYVPDPKPGHPQPFASMEYFTNPFDSDQLAIWRKLACQTHWHLTLLGAGNEVAGFFEFENVFGLDEALLDVEQHCRGQSLTDFAAAKQEFFDTISVDELFQMR